MLFYENHILDAVFDSQMVAGGDAGNSCTADHNIGS